MKIIAHRGYSEKYPENTLLAFEKALACGVDGIETDIRLSLDHIPFVFHDSSLKRLADIPRAPEDLNLAQLQALSLNEGEHIPSLQELLDLIQGKTMLILEIKYNPLTYKRLCEIICIIISDKLSWIEVSCFDDHVLEYIHALNPAIRLHKLIDDPLLLDDEDLEIRYDYTSYFDIDVKLRQSVRKRGLFNGHKIIYWTVDREDITQDKEAGLYAIMTNNPTLFI